MKPGINQWAFPHDMPVEDCMHLAKQSGFEAFEVCVGESGPISLDARESDIIAIRRMAESCGLVLHSVACGDGWKYPLTATDESVRDKAKETISKTLQIAHWLDADSILVVPGVVDAETYYDVAIENALAGVRDLADTAEELQVSIALENVWNKFLLSPVEMRDFIDQCESAFVGAYVDVGNMLVYGYPEHWLRILDHRVHAVHMKDFRMATGNINGFVMLMEGDVNWPAVMAALRDIEYDRGLIAEFGPYTHSLEAMLNHVAVSLHAIQKL